MGSPRGLVELEGGGQPGLPAAMTGHLMRGVDRHRETPRRDPVPAALRPAHRRAARPSAVTHRGSCLDGGGAREVGSPVTGCPSRPSSRAAVPTNPREWDRLFNRRGSAVRAAPAAGSAITGAMSDLPCSDPLTPPPTRPCNWKVPVRRARVGSDLAGRGRPQQFPGDRFRDLWPKVSSARLGRGPRRQPAGVGRLTEVWK